MGQALLIVRRGSGQLRPRQVLHPTDELRTAAKARPNLGVGGTSLPPGENPPFQGPEDLRIGRRARFTPRPRTQGQDLEHTPSAAPESPGHLGRVNTGRYEPAYPPLNRAQVCLAGYYVRFHHDSTISRTTPTQFASSKRHGERGRDGLLSVREGQGSKGPSWARWWAAHIRRVIREYVIHYNCRRPHRGLDLEAPAGEAASSHPSFSIHRSGVLGGLIHEYYPVAA